MKSCPTIKRSGFTRTGLVVVIGTVAMLVGLFWPALAPNKGRGRRISCANNLKQLGLALRIWSGDHEDRYPMSMTNVIAGAPDVSSATQTFRYFQILSNELVVPKFLICPSDDRVPAVNFQELTNTNISYFIGLDADESRPQVFLAGDRNLLIKGAPARTGVVSLTARDRLEWSKTLHERRGNIALADGSVAGFSLSHMEPTDTNVIHLAFP